MTDFRGRLRVALVAVALLLAAANVSAGEPEAAPLRSADDLVASVLDRIDERLALMPTVAAAKWARSQPVADPAREAIVIGAARERAAATGLEPDSVARLFELQIRLARAAQESLLARWRQGTTVVPDHTPGSLADNLRPRLDRLTGAIISALYLAAPALAAPDAEPRLARLAVEHLPDSRFVTADRAELTAALAAVRLAMPRSLGRARRAGWLRIGTPGDYAPFSVASGDVVTGSDVVLAQRLAAALGLTPVFVRSSWRTLLQDLADDRFDIAVGGISVTAERLAAASFSLPTSHSGKTALGRCADRERLGSLDAIDRPSIRVIENAGGTNEAFARAHISAAALTIHADNRTVIDEILAHRADVMFTDDTEVAFATHRHPELCRLLDHLYAPADKAFLLPRDPAWADAVNRWLQDELARGTPARLLDEYLAH